MMDRVLAALCALRVPAVISEADLHQMIARAFADAGIEAMHECKLAPRCRIDFLCANVGVEVKQGEQARGKLLHQAQKYLALPQLEALVLVTTRGVNLPGSIAGKRLVVFGLNRLWGVALP